MAGAAGFEPATLGFGDRCSDRTELRSCVDRLLTALIADLAFQSRPEKAGQPENHRPKSAPRSVILSCPRAMVNQIGSPVGPRLEAPDLCAACHVSPTSAPVGPADTVASGGMPNRPRLPFYSNGGNSRVPRCGPSQLSSLARCIAPPATNRLLVTDQSVPSHVISSAGTVSIPTIDGGGLSAGW